VLAPVGAPRVTTDPVLGAVSTHTPTNDGDDVVVFNVVEVFGVDSASVLFESVSGIDQAGNRSSVIITSLVQSSYNIRLYFETMKKQRRNAAFNDMQNFFETAIFEIITSGSVLLTYLAKISAFMSLTPEIPLKSVTV
jgi:hypothetical protein